MLYCNEICMWSQISLLLVYKPEKAMAPHSRILAWRIPWTEQPGRLQSMGSQRIRHEWATNTSLSFHFHGSGTLLVELEKWIRKNSSSSWDVYKLLWSLCVLSRFNRVWLFATPWTVARQALQSMGFSRQEYWSELPSPPWGDLVSCFGRRVLNH